MAKFGKGMSFSFEQAFVRRDEIRAPLKTIVQNKLLYTMSLRDIFQLVKMVYSMVRYVSGGVFRKAFFYKGFVILIQLRISLQLLLRPNGALPSLSFVVRDMALAIFKL